LTIAKTHPLGTLVDKSHKPREPGTDDEVWNLNLDQIEPHSGRVLSKCRLCASELGPSTYAFDRGTVLYSKLRPYLNKVVVADDDGVATTELVPLRCDESRLNARYLAHFLRGPDFLRFATNVVSGAKMPRMIMSEFWKFPVPLPPLPEQRRIAAILDQADALRAKRREALAQLGSLTQSIFIEMFGDPVRNSKGWPLVRFATKLSAPLRNGLSPSSEGKLQAQVLTLSAITGDDFNPSAKKLGMFVSKPPTTQSVDENDFLICRGNGNMNLVGKGHFPKSNMPDVTFPDTMIAARLSPNRVGMAFLEAFWNSPAVRFQIEGLARTTNGTFKVNQPMLEGVVIADPPLGLQQTFATRIQAVEALKTTHRAGLAELDALFAALQHRAFSGQLSA